MKWIHVKAVDLAEKRKQCCFAQRLQASKAFQLILLDVWKVSAKFMELFKLNMSSSIYRSRSREKLYNLQLKHFFQIQQTCQHPLSPSLSTAVSCRTQILIQHDWYNQKAKPGLLKNFIKATDFHFKHRNELINKLFPLHLRHSTASSRHSHSHWQIWRSKNWKWKVGVFRFEGYIYICTLRDDLIDMKHNPKLMGALLLSLLYRSVSPTISV